ncbi:hypothetical protein EVAR_56293_1 [Eumeta japonica]|uniref:Uncharacterized protein n=1 Tax=Eumeta variegata TaxID=151549 RepID=A0A4C1SNB5_EUMVA|nr:hypothetical protein EVAR_56293_1 [Eumeta japonica]
MTKEVGYCNSHSLGETQQRKLPLDAFSGERAARAAPRQLVMSEYIPGLRGPYEYIFSGYPAMFYSWGSGFTIDTFGITRASPLPITSSARLIITEDEPLRLQSHTPAPETGVVGANARASAAAGSIAVYYLRYMKQRTKYSRTERLEFQSRTAFSGKFNPTRAEFRLNGKTRLQDVVNAVRSTVR